MSQKYVMGGPEWLAAINAAFVASRQSMTLTRDISLCEVYRNAPRSVTPEGQVAFNARLRANSMDVDFDTCEADDVTIKLTWDYDAVVPLGRFAVGGDPARAEQMTRMLTKAIADGRVQVQGDLPPELMESPVHDIMASLTA